MNTRTTQTFTLSADDIKRAITEWLEKYHGKGQPLTVTLSAEAKTVGFGTGESTAYVPVISATRTLP